MSLAVLGGSGQALAAVILALAASCGGDGESGGNSNEFSSWSYIADHSCTDIADIPTEWIRNVQEGVRLHYAHTSHGSQLTIGLESIEDAIASHEVEIEYSNLPEQSGRLCIYDGQAGETYISPDLFWESDEGLNMTKDVLDHNPSINVCMWAWCCQLDYYGEGEVAAYLSALSTLESEYPDVTFVYMTGNAQASGAEGYNRFLRNNQVREYCERGGLALFDFADLDCWRQNPSTGEWQQNTYRYDGIDIPLEHQAFSGDEAGHTTYESCEQKGRALWWLLASIAGWSGN